MFIKPTKEGLKVFDPATKLHISMKGKKVAKSNYWLRRIAEGDVVEVKEVKEKSIKKVKNQPKKTMEVKS